MKAMIVVTLFYLFIAIGLEVNGVQIIGENALFVVGVSLAYLWAIVGVVYGSTYLRKKRATSRETFLTEVAATAESSQANSMEFMLYAIGLLFFGGWFLASFLGVEAFVAYESWEKLMKWRYYVPLFALGYFVVIVGFYRIIRKLFHK
ncbi:hypothetical protein [Shouchella lonarensis]|uniref:Uncharacterized protein n=1 Tax=Shouchella lonarensis TaxID=1464122 RepID=A0A1G6INZ8_9BACI|nr:hypothetical protein [Shouchella lonarensis]SDC08141.1 hypothetical protein SAMN05421737_105124 [Shouchella lonarensis]